MTSHGLAKMLLSNPDLPVVIHTVNGFEEIKTFEVEPEGKQLQLVYKKDQLYKMVPNPDNDRAIILMSQSFGAN